MKKVKLKFRLIMILNSNEEINPLHLSLSKSAAQNEFNEKDRLCNLVGMLESC